MTDHAADARIAIAATRLFREQGVVGASMRDIADAAGLMLGSLTYRFPTKASLLVAVMEESFARAKAEIRVVTGGENDPLRALQLALRVHMRHLVDPQSGVWLVIHEWGRLPEDVRDELRILRLEYEDAWREMVVRARSEGLLAEGIDDELVFHFVFGAANTVATWFDPAGPLSPEDIADRFSAFIALGVASEDARASLIANPLLSLSRWQHE